MFREGETPVEPLGTTAQGQFMNCPYVFPDNGLPTKLRQVLPADKNIDNES